MMHRPRNMTLKWVMKRRSNLLYPDIHLHHNAVLLAFWVSAGYTWSCSLLWEDRIQAKDIDPELKEPSIYSGLKDNSCIFFKSSLRVWTIICRRPLAWDTGNLGPLLPSLWMCSHFYLPVLQLPPLRTAQVIVHLFDQQTLTGRILGIRVSVRISR